ncbi:hypothetical protein JCM5350_005128 [Sporobolomyces pararoseus]
MAIRRPPTAISLKPSDVAELREFIANRNKEDNGKQSQPGPSTSSSGATNRDAILEKEKKEAEEREARGARARVMGQ